MYCLVLLDVKYFHILVFSMQLNLSITDALSSLLRAIYQYHVSSYVTENICERILSQCPFATFLGFCCLLKERKTLWCLFSFLLVWCKSYSKICVWLLTNNSTLHYALRFACLQRSAWDWIKGRETKTLFLGKCKFMKSVCILFSQEILDCTHNKINNFIM